MVEPTIRVDGNVDTSSESYRALQTQLAAEGIALPADPEVRLARYKTDYL